jgi:hypothetical protein
MDLVKPKNWKIWILLALAALSSPTTWARGGVDSGGGDAYAQSFVETGWLIFNQLGAIRELRVDLPALKKAIQNVNVISTDERLYLNGEEKDLINEPSLNKITLNRARWRENSQAQRKMIALHEYLRFVGIDDSKYQVSAAIASDLSQNPFTQLSDTLQGIFSEASLLLPEVGSIKRTAVCYKLSSLNSAIKNARRLYSEIPNLSWTPSNNCGGEMERLHYWEDALRQFCLGDGKIPSSTGALLPDTDKNLRMFVTLVIRDAEISRAEVLNQLGQSPAADPTEIWDRYRDRF